MGTQDSNLSHGEKDSLLQTLKQMFSDLPDAKLIDVLTKTKWDYEKALDCILNETFQQRDQ